MRRVSISKCGYLTMEQQSERGLRPGQVSVVVAVHVDPLPVLGPGRQVLNKVSVCFTESHSEIVSTLVLALVIVGTSADLVKLGVG